MSPIPAPPAPPAVPGLGFGRWAFHGVAAPLRSVARRPFRAAVLLGIALLTAGLLSAAGIHVWFGRHLSAARSELEKGHNATALRHLRECQRVRPNDREVLILLARTARRSGAWEEAESLLDRYWQLYGDEDALVFERLLLRATRGEIEAVGPQLQARIRADGDGPAAALAREALVTGFVYRFLWGEADRQLDEWLSHSPDATAALLLRGKLQEQRAQTPSALDTYRRLLALDPDHDEARLRLTTLLLGNRLGAEALPHLARLRARLPDNPEVAVQWARALALLGRTAESREALDACLRAHADYPQSPKIM